MDDERKAAALPLFLCGYAMLLDEPETSVLVQELALAAVEGVGAAAHVQRHGHGWYEIEVAQGRYVRTNPKLRGPAYRRE